MNVSAILLFAMGRSRIAVIFVQKNLNLEAQVSLDVILKKPGALFDTPINHGTHVSIPLAVITLLIHAKNLYGPRSSIYKDDKRLVLSILRYAGWHAFNGLSLDLLAKQLPTEVATLLRKQVSKSKLWKFGFFTKTFDTRIIDLINSIDIVKPQRTTDRFSGAIAMQDVLSILERTDRDEATMSEVCFFAKNNEDRELASWLASKLTNLTRQSLSNTLNKQAKFRIEQRRNVEKTIKDDLGKDGENFFDLFENVISQAHVLVPVELLDEIIAQLQENRDYDFVAFLPLFQIAEQEIRPFSQLAHGIGKWGLVFGRQNSWKKYWLHTLKLKPGRLFANFIVTKISDEDERTHGRYAGYYLDYKKFGQTIRGYTGGERENIDAKAFLLHPDQYGLTRRVLPLYPSLQTQIRCYESINFNSATKPFPRPVAAPIRNKYLALSLCQEEIPEEDIVVMIDLVVEKLKKKKKAKKFVEDICRDRDLAKNLTRYINQGEVPREVLNSMVLHVRNVKKYGTFRTTYRQIGASRIFFTCLNIAMQALLSEVDEKLGYCFHNYLPAVYTLSPVCAGKLREVIASNDQVMIFNADVRKCFDSLDFSKPWLRKWLARSEAIVSRLVPKAALLLKQMVDTFVDLANKGDFHPDRVPGRVVTGLILLPCVWLYLTLPLAMKLKDHLDSGDVLFFSVCGDDFFAVLQGSVSQTVTDDITNFFYEFSEDLGLSWHKFKNYQKGEKADFSDRRPPTDSFFFGPWPKHLDFFHGGMHLRRDSLLPARATIPAIIEEDILRSNFRKDYKIGHRTLPFIYRDILPHDLNPSGDSGIDRRGSVEAEVSTLTRQNLAKLLYDPGKSVHCGFFQMISKEERVKWLLPLTQKVEIRSHDPVQTEETVYTRLSRLKDLKQSFLNIKSSYKVGLETRVELIKKGLDVLCPDFLIDLPSDVILKVKLLDLEQLTAVMALQSRDLFDLPRDLRLFVRGLMECTPFCDLTGWKRFTGIPLALLFTDGGTSIDDLHRGIELLKLLDGGQPIVPKLTFYFDDEKREHVYRTNKYEVSRGFEAIFRDYLTLTLAVGESGVRNELPNFTRSTSDQMERRKALALRCFAAGNLQAALSYCDEGAIDEVKTALGGFRKLLTGKTRLKPWLESIRSKVDEDHLRTDEAWETLNEHVETVLTIFNEVNQLLERDAPHTLY